jgi:AAA+ ATPase superfamily predicted ATPase
MPIIGRRAEIARLDKILLKEEASFLAVYGRRRIGKTFLIEQYFMDKDCLFIQVTGLKDGSYTDQLQLLKQALEKTFALILPLRDFEDWMDGLEQLSKAIETQLPAKRVVVFFDELPWLATQKSGLMQALDHYWNTRWSKYSRFIFIACGSAASWMLEKLVHAKGGLHNRLTDIMRLQPFTLQEVKEFLESRYVHKNNEQILQLYMAMGGVAHYLKQIDPALSVAQNINTLCFHPDGLLFNEFDDLYQSLFKNSEAHRELVTIIASKKMGISREILSQKAKLSSNGGLLTKRLKELEEAGFISGFIPYGYAARGQYFQVCDEYSLFYLTWIKPAKEALKRFTGPTAYWENKSQSHQYHIWSGLAYESICYKHIESITKILKIQHLVMGVHGWRVMGNGENSGAQIDMLIDRNDNAINIIEMKYYNDVFAIDKSYAAELEHKLTTFQTITGCKKELLLTFVTVHGVKLNMYSREWVAAEVILDDFFDQHVSC